MRYGILKNKQLKYYSILSILDFKSMFNQLTTKSRFRVYTMIYEEPNKPEIYSLNENVIKVLTIHSAKGLESDNVLVLNAGCYNDEERREYEARISVDTKNKVIQRRLLELA